MSVELSPPELGFKRPFTQEVTQALHLRNPNHDPVAFKVKTTAPKQYCVRPNSGRIEAGKEVEVQVLLQAMKEDPPPDAKCRDKFLVQSVAITADREFSNVAAIWQHVEQSAKGSIQEKKIRVSFLPAGGSSLSTPVHNNVNGIQHDAVPSSEPPAYTPSTEQSTPSRAPPVGAVSKPESRPANSKNLGDARAAAREWTAPDQSTAKSVASSFASAVPSPSDAKAAASRTAEGLRQRKTALTGGSESAPLATTLAPPEGVPVPIVAGLCLLSFLIAYLFF